MTSEAAATPIATARFARKRTAIIAAATDVLNRQGVKGMTLAEVAAQVGLNTTSITYYFRKKEDLAAACYLAGIERITGMLDDAAALGAPEARIARFIELFLKRHAERRDGSGPPLVMFQGIRTLEPPHYAEVTAAFTGMVRRARDLFAEALGARQALHVQTFLMLEQVFWSAAWLGRYEIDDYPRVGARMFDVLAYGLAAQPGPIPITPLHLRPEPLRDAGRETFLVASTRLINQLGYRGASVERISAELNVTKGSFYHHNEAKDELVEACFERTGAFVQRVQRAAMTLPETGLGRVAAAAGALFAFQGSPQGPLLRSHALGAMAEPLRSRVKERAQRVTERFAAMIADGVTDGSIRAVDPTIAAHMLEVALACADELPLWVKGADVTAAPDLLLAPLLHGVLNPRLRSA
jgi:AcrR family transcriptional regulator